MSSPHIGHCMVLEGMFWQEGSKGIFVTQPDLVPSSLLANAARCLGSNRQKSVIERGLRRCCQPRKRISRYWTLRCSLALDRDAEIVLRKAKEQASELLRRVDADVLRTPT